MNNQNMKLKSAKTVVQEHISTLNHLNEIPPPLPPTLITTSINNWNSSPPTSKGSNNNNTQFGITGVRICPLVLHAYTKQNGIYTVYCFFHYRRSQRVEEVKFWAG